MLVGNHGKNLKRSLVCREGAGERRRRSLVCRKGFGDVERFEQLEWK